MQDLLLFFHMQPTHQPKITGVALWHKKVGCPCFSLLNISHKSRKSASVCHHMLAEPFKAEWLPYQIRSHHIKFIGWVANSQHHSHFTPRFPEYLLDMRLSKATSWAGWSGWTYLPPETKCWSCSLLPSHCNDQVNQLPFSAINHKPCYNLTYFLTHLKLYSFGFGKTVHLDSIFISM